MINIHIIPGTIIKFIANYIKGRKTYTTYRSRTSSQRKFKTGVPQGDVLLPTLSNIYTADIPESKNNLDLKINNTALPMATHPKVLGLTLDLKLTYSTHIQGKQKETLMVTYRAVMRPAVEYASSIWSPLASSTSINKLQVMQNAALRTAT